MSAPGVMTYATIVPSANVNSSTILWTVLRLYYSDADLSATFSEDSLRVYKFNTSTYVWDRYDTPNGGVNTTENYVWANLTEFSNFSIGGLKINGQSCSAAAECNGGYCCSGSCGSSACSTGGSPGGGGGGTAGVSAPRNIFLNPKFVTDTYQATLSRNEKATYEYRGVNTTITITDVTDSNATFTAGANDYILLAGQSKGLDLDNDGTNDLTISLDSISVGTGLFTFTRLAAAPSRAPPLNNTAETNETIITPPVAAPFNWNPVIALILIIALAGGFYLYTARMRKR
jgi:hypothetical protein